MFRGVFSYDVNNLLLQKFYGACEMSIANCRNAPTPREGDPPTH